MDSCVIVMAVSIRVGGKSPNYKRRGLDGEFLGEATRGGREQDLCKIGISYVSPEGEGSLMGPTMAGGRGTIARTLQSC